MAGLNVTEIPSGSRGRRGVAAIFPGLRYGPDRPLLAMAIATLKHRGFHVLLASHDYTSDAFSQLSDEEKLAQIHEDGHVFQRDHLQRFPGEPWMLVGKSLGTVSICGMDPAALPEHSAIAWLTPSLLAPGLTDAIARFPQPAFSLIGSEDPSVELARSAQHRGLASLTYVEVQGADHGWGHAGGDAATAHIEAEAQSTFDTWLNTQAGYPPINN